MTTLSIIGEEWLSMRANRQHRSANTILAGRSALRQLIATAGDIQPKHLTERHVDAFVTRISGGAPATFNSRLSHVRSFMTFCRGRGYVPRDFDPFREMVSSKDLRRERDRVPVSEFNSLLDACTHPRDRALLAIGLFTMLRAGEIRSLRIRDLDLDGLSLDAVIWKTKDTDRMPLDGLFASELRQWLTFYTDKAGGTCKCLATHPSKPLCPEFYLVPSKAPARLPGPGEPSNGRPNGFQRDTGQGDLRPAMPCTQMQRAVQKALDALGYGSRQEGMHTLRRSAARALFDSLVEQGYDGALRLVQSMLHHKNSTMTEHYIGLREDRHRRDKLIRGGVMFPVMAAQQQPTTLGVVPLRPTAEP